MLGQVARRRAVTALVLVGLLAHGTGRSMAGAEAPGGSRASGNRLLSEQLSLEEWARPAARRLPALALVVQGPTNAPGAPLTRVDPAADDDPSVFGKWWFWAAVGAVVATTVILFVVASDGSDVPNTRLGDMEIFK